MISLDQCRHLNELFERGIQHLLAEINPERAFLAYREKSHAGAAYPTPYVVHGFSLANLFTTEDISTEIVRQALVSGEEATLLMDAIDSPGFNARNSVLISGLRSVMTVPLRHSNGSTVGLIYADSRVRAGAFKEEHVERVKRLAQSLVAPLATVEKRMGAEVSAVVLDTDWGSVKVQAMALAKDHRGDEAVALLERWIKGREPGPELGMAHGVRGRILERAGDDEAALEALSCSVWMLGRNATSPDENYSLMLNNLAGVHVSLGYLERARGLLRASLEQWRRLALPGDRQLAGLAATSYNLGSLHQKMGQNAEAVPWMTHALEASEKAFGPKHERTQQIRRVLESLQS